MSTEDLRYSIEAIESAGNDASGYLDDVEEELRRWSELSEALSMDTEEIQGAVINWQESCGYLKDAGFHIDDSTNVKEAIESLSSNGAASEIIVALKFLVSTLVDSGVLAGTVSGLGIVKIGHPEPAFGGAESAETLQEAKPRVREEA